MELLVKALLIIGGIVIAWGLVEVGVWLLDVLRRPGAGHLALGSFRLYSLLGDANMASSFLNLLLPLGLVRLFTARRWRHSRLLAAWCVANLIVQFFTSSRGGWLGTAVALASLAVLLWLSNPDDWRGRVAAWAQRWLERSWVRVLLGAVGLVALAAFGYVALRQLRHPSHGDLWLSRREFWRSAWLAFLSSPLHGTGPFTYGTDFFRYSPVPPWRPYPHAHSVPLTALVEGGVLGVLSGVALLGAMVLAVRRTWQRAWGLFPPSQRWQLCGAIAALAGFATHSLMDNHTLVPAVAMVAVAILAIAVSLECPSEERRSATKNDVRDLVSPARGGDPGWSPKAGARGIAAAWLVVPAVVLVVAGFVSDWAYAPFAAGLEAANAGNWQDAAALMDVAAQRDSRLAFYHLQRGFAWGMTAADPKSATGGALDAAIQAYQRGVALEPDYSANHANLGALYWQAGRRDLAVAEMERARSLSPASIYAFNLGRYYEDIGQTEKAVENYVAVLNGRSDLADAGYYWSRTAVRRQALARWQSAHPAPSLSAPPATASDYLAIGQAAEALSDWPAAQSAFARAQALAPDSLEAFLGLGQTALAQHRLDDAERTLRQGLGTFTMDEGRKLDLLLAYAQLAREQGRLEEAARRDELALGMVEKPTVYGRGTLGWSPYGWFLFQRESIAPDLLPQLARLEVTDALADRYVELGRWYEELGRAWDAASAYRRILTVIPDFTPALEGMERVGGPQG